MSEGIQLYQQTLKQEIKASQLRKLTCQTVQMEFT